MRERRCENGVGNGAHRCSVFVLVVPNGERRFPATFDYGVNGESRTHEDTVSDTAPYTSDLFLCNKTPLSASHQAIQHNQCETHLKPSATEHVT